MTQPASPMYVDGATPIKEPRKLLRIPCESWACRREHEWLPVGPTAALYHVDERAEEPPKP